MKINKVAYMGVFIALAFVLSYIEMLIPFHIGAYGAKLGLANLVIVICLYRYGIKDAAILSIVRVVLVGLTFTSPVSMLYSLAGTCLSLLVMYILKKIGTFSVVGVSALGGVMHNLGQLFVAMVILGTSGLVYYSSVLVLCGILTGLLIGIISSYVLQHLKTLN